MSDLLTHIMDLKEAVAANTALLQETRADVKSVATTQARHDTRLVRLEFWPKAGKMTIAVVVGLASFTATVYGLVVAIQSHSSRPVPTLQVPREDRVSPSP